MNYVVKLLPMVEVRLIKRNHLCLSHPSKYSNLFPDDEKVEDKQRNYMSVVRLSASSHRAIITEAVTDFIVKDVRPVSTVDGEGFTNLMQVAEPRYTVPCNKTNMGLIHQKFLLLKNHMKSQLIQIVRAIITIN